MGFLSEKKKKAHFSNVVISSYWYYLKLFLIVMRIFALSNNQDFCIKMSQIILCFILAKDEI